MNKTVTIFLVVAALALTGYSMYNLYLQPGKNSISDGEPVFVAGSPLPENNQEKQGTQTSIVETQNISYTVESYVQNLSIPWSMVFTSPTRLLVTERPGRVRVVENGKLLEKPIRVFEEVLHQAEEGLMGMTLDPNYATNKYVYLCMAYGEPNASLDKVVRVVDTGTNLEQDKIILDKIPAAHFHAGCRVRFGPDGKLYISTGDATKKDEAQNKQYLGGKMLRVNPDGSIPSDNPIAGSAVWSYGHRNPQGFDWNPVSGTLVETEHGPSGNDGPGGGDEVNIIKKGENYGWPIVSHEKTRDGMVNPKLVFTPAIAPASGMFYSGNIFPQFKNNFFFGMLRGEGIMRVVFDPNNPEKVLSYEKLKEVNVGRVRDVVQGADGYIYFTTSNTDGRGKKQQGDDNIYRLIPSSAQTQ